MPPRYSTSRNPHSNTHLRPSLRTTSSNPRIHSAHRILNPPNIAFDPSIALLLEERDSQPIEPQEDYNAEDQEEQGPMMPIVSPIDDYDVNLFDPQGSDQVNLFDPEGIDDRPPSPSPSPPILGHTRSPIISRCVAFFFCLSLLSISHSSDSDWN